MLALGATHEAHCLIRIDEKEITQLWPEVLVYEQVKELIVCSTPVTIGLLEQQRCVFVPVLDSPSLYRRSRLTH
jgi:hypothetical protein